MDNNANPTETKNFAESNKLAFDLSFILLILLILVSTFASANPHKYHYKYNRYNKNNKTITIGLEGGLAQKTMVYTIDNFNQKYIEIGARLSLAMQMNKNMYLEIAALGTLNNPAPNTNYNYSDNNRLASLSYLYRINLNERISIEPKIGIGLLQHREYVVNIQDGNESSIKQTQVVVAGLRAKYHFNKNFAIGGGGDYIFASGNLSFPYAYGGLYFSFNADGMGIERRCPSKF